MNLPTYGILKAPSVHSCLHQHREKHGRHAKMVLLILDLGIVSLIVAWEGTEPQHLLSEVFSSYQLATTVILVVMNA